MEISRVNCVVSGDVRELSEALLTNRLVVDVELRRPGCALLQAAMGGDPGIANLFDADKWLIAPTPAMKCYSISDEQLEQFREEVNH